MGKTIKLKKGIYLYIGKKHTYRLYNGLYLPKPYRAWKAVYEDGITTIHGKSKQVLLNKIESLEGNTNA